jgi:hypothetical protein
MNLSFRVRQALPTEREALLPLFEELDEHHRLARPDVFRKPSGARREPALLDPLIAGPSLRCLRNKSELRRAEHNRVSREALPFKALLAAAINRVGPAVAAYHGRAERGMPPPEIPDYRNKSCA